MPARVQVAVTGVAVPGCDATILNWLSAVKAGPVGIVEPVTLTTPDCASLEIL